MNTRFQYLLSTIEEKANSHSNSGYFVEITDGTDGVMGADEFMTPLCECLANRLEMDGYRVAKGYYNPNTGKCKIDRNDDISYYKCWLVLAPTCEDIIDTLDNILQGSP